MLTNFPAINEILPPSPFPNVFVDTALFEPVDQYGIGCCEVHAAALAEADQRLPASRRDITTLASNLRAVLKSQAANIPGYLTGVAVPKRRGVYPSARVHDQ